MMKSWYPLISVGDQVTPPTAVLQGKVAYRQVASRPLNSIQGPEAANSRSWSFSSVTSVFLLVMKYYCIQEDKHTEKREPKQLVCVTALINTVPTTRRLLRDKSDAFVHSFTMEYHSALKKKEIGIRYGGTLAVKAGLLRVQGQSTQWDPVFKNQRKEINTHSTTDEPWGCFVERNKPVPRSQILLKSLIQKPKVDGWRVIAGKGNGSWCLMGQRQGSGGKSAKGGPCL